MIPIQAHETAYHEKYRSKRLLLLMQRSIGQIQAFPFDWLKQFFSRTMRGQVPLGVSNMGVLP